MASVSVMNAPEQSVLDLGHGNFAHNVDTLQQEGTNDGDCTIKPTDELRYTLESYQPSQLQDSPDSYGGAASSLQHHYTASTQGYSSGYMTGSSYQKTPEMHFRMSTKPDQDAQHQEGGDVWQREECTTPHCSVSPPQPHPINIYSNPVAEPPHHSVVSDNGPHFENSAWQVTGDDSSVKDTHPPCFKPRPARPLLAIMRQLQDLDPSLRQLLKNADNHLRKRNLDKAVQCFEESLLQTNDYPRLQMVIWMLLGSTHTQLRQYKKASVCHLHYLAFCREMEDFHGMTRAECNLGIAYMKLGLTKLSGRCFLQYLDNSRILQDDIGIGAACSNLGMLSKTLGMHGYKEAIRDGDRERAIELLSTNLYRAVAYFEQHLDIMEQYGDLEKQARAYGNLGSCYELLKQFTQAIFCHNKRLEIVQTIGDKVSECCSLCNLGNCFRATGKLQEAMEYYHLALELSRVTRNPQVEMVSLLNLGITCELRNKLDKAIEWHTLYLSMAVQLNDVQSQARGFSTMAGLYEETGQMKKAHEYYNKLVDVFKQLGENDAKLAAASYLQTVRQLVKEEKKRNKTSSRGTLRKRFRNVFRPHTISRASGITSRDYSSSFIPQKDKPKRSGHTRDKMGTWSVAKGQQYLRQQKTPVSNSESFSSSCTLVFENPATAFLNEQYKYQAEVASHVADQADLYSRVTSTPESNPSFPNENQFQDPVSFTNEGHPYPFYSLVNVMGTSPSPTSTDPSYPSYLPPPPPREFAENEICVDIHCNTDAESTTDYESVPDNVPSRQSENRTTNGAYASIHVNRELDYIASQSSSICSTSTYGGSQIWGSERHVEELQRLGEDLTQTSGVSELEEGVDKEWEQWLNLRDVNALSRVVSVNMGQISNGLSGRGNGLSKLKPTLSAPEVDLNQNDEDDTSSIYTDSSLPL